MKIVEEYNIKFENEEEYRQHVKKSCDEFKKNTSSFKNRLIKGKGEKKIDGKTE